MGANCLVKNDDIFTRNPWLTDFVEFFNTLDTESDRGIVLICGSVLEDALGQAIRARLVDHSKVKDAIRGQLFGNFNSRIVGCLALGIINESEYANLEVIRQIRNKFAHKMRVSFADLEISALCAQLTDFSDEKRHKQRFAYTAASLIFDIHLRAHDDVPKRLTYEPTEPAIEELHLKLFDQLRRALDTAGETSRSGPKPEK